MPTRDPRQTMRIDSAAECIWRDGEKVGVPPKAFLVLRRLLERPGELLTKSELLEAIWPDTFVTETVLNNAVGQLRQALGDDPKRPSFIETVHRRGFRWIGPAAGDAPATPAGSVIDQADLGGSEVAAFVGRAETLAELARSYARAAAGQRQLILISGEPGIGKTALVDEFIKGLGVNPVTPYLLARGQCIEAYGAGDLYRPLREAVEQLWRGGGEETREVFRTHAPSWVLSMPELASAAELEVLRRRVISSTLDSVQRELERAIVAASAQRTIVLVLEDLHWSEPATVALLWALAARREPTRLLMIGTYRSVDAIAQQHPITRLKRELTAKRQCVELALDGLPGDAVGTFLDRHFPHHELSSGFAARLCEQTTGNPLFLLNALADFERRGWLQQEEGVWRCTVDLDSVFAAVPESTRELIAFRLDQLAPPTRELLEAASIVGETFATQTVAAATERECAEVEAELEPLARAAFFLERGDEIEWPDDTRGCQHRFRHALYRQVLLGGIPPSRRQLLHRRIALALESAYGDRVGEIARPLSLHHEHAGEALRAVDYIEMLVQQAYARSAAPEAEVLLGHAVGLLKRNQTSAARRERLLKVMIAHGTVLSTTRGVASVESLRVIEEAHALGRSMPSSSLEQIASMGTMGAAKVMRGQLREARGLAEEALALVGSEPSPYALLSAHATLGTSLLHLGEIDPALRHLERAVAALDETSPAAAKPPIPGWDPVVPAYVFLAVAFFVSGRPEKGRAAIASALSAASTSEMPWYYGLALDVANSMALVRRDLAETRQLASEVLAYASEKALPLWELGTQIRLGWCDVLESRDANLIDRLRALVDEFRTTGHLNVCLSYCALTDACLSVGRIDDAADALVAAFDTRAEVRLFDVELFRLRGVIARARAEKKGAKDSAIGDAEQSFEKAIEIAKAQGTRLFGLRATVDLCRLWLTTGKRDQARLRLSEALAAFDEGFGETDLREARAMLDTLGARTKPRPRPRT